VAILTLCVIVAFIVAPGERARRAAEAGEPEIAEPFYWKVLQKNPNDLEAWVRFVIAHAEIIKDGTSFISEAQIKLVLDRVSNPQTATLAKNWYAAQVTREKVDIAPVIALADAQQPPRLANYIAARIALLNDDWATAAQRYEREGFLFPKERQRFLAHAIDTWVDHDAWGEIEKRANDPRYAKIFDAALRLELAAHQRDIVTILIELWPASYVHTHVWPVALAILAAALWFAISTRLGRISDDDAPHGRATLYVLAFVLGVLSIYPTLLLSVVEEAMVGLKETGDIASDAIYFIAGVGFREELCKLLLFLPLMPALLRRGSRIEAMTCGALVGLGFGAEENIGYFNRSLGSALPRFMTANFLHMSLTALVALAVYDTSRGRQTSRDSINVVFPLAVIVHGFYDLLIGEMGLAIVAMFLLIFISRQFIRQLVIASSRAEEKDVMRLLILSMALLTGVSYIYASSIVGPTSAVGFIGSGTFGVFIVVYMFMTELG
jgi:RsiW-degrading membrane proteinase PrsW (M82 family)